MFTAEIASYLQTIRALITVIKTSQVEKGYSQQQVNLYLKEKLREQFDPSITTPSIEQLIATLILKYKSKAQQFLSKIVSCLDIEKYNVTRKWNYRARPEEDFEKIDILPQTNNTSAQQAPEEKSLDQISFEMQGVHLFESRSIKTPRIKAQKYTTQPLKTSEIFQELNVVIQCERIEKSIQETLERTRKIRSFLNQKLKKEKISKPKFQDNFHLDRQLLDDWIDSD